ncbi:RmlC-like cupin domain-containing protein [Hyaloraphidium curvatum]|nr:RmlC-like cupin domain-containing protein [Hyaloraphidium curvatum]
MTAAAPPTRAQVVVPCAELDGTLAFFTDRLGFRVDAISPADGPRAAEVSGHGISLLLSVDAAGPPPALRLVCDEPKAVAGGALELTAPNGTRIELVPAHRPVVVPPIHQTFELVRRGDNFGVGRAGMQYRDLLPSRQNGRFIASHIRIPSGGPVPDYVHFHKIRFQMIFCYRGWVKVVYEDQGEPFVMNAGDCVLQPPEIRHRVLEASAGLEVIEIGCPALHDTVADHSLELPNRVGDPDRLFGGQKFVRHVADGAAWAPWRAPGFEARDLGIGAATDGLAGARVVRPTAGAASAPLVAAGELCLHVVLDGTVTLERDGQKPEVLRAGDSVALPAGERYRLAGSSADLEMLDVTLPA